VHAAARDAVAAIRADGQPRFLELVTYRLRGHFEPDDQAYVDADELARWQARDPLQGQADRLLALGALDAADLVQLRDRVAARIEAAARFAQASAWPDPRTLTHHVYAEQGARS